jgi:hypothetical protein
MAPKPGSSHSSSSSSLSSSSSSSNSSFLRRAVSVRCVASVLYLLVAAAALTAVARFYRLRLAAGVAAAPLPSLAAVFRNPGRAFAQVVGPSASAAGGLGGPGAGAGAAAPASAAELRRARRAERKAQRESFKDTAIVTLATGDAAARHAVVLIKTLRDTGTLIPRIVVLLSRGGMGSADCHNETLRNKRNRHYHCSSPLAEADDIVSQRYLDAFARMGVEVRIIDPIKDTKYTALIPGGRATFWGMSFNKVSARAGAPQAGGRGAREAALSGRARARARARAARPSLPRRLRARALSPPHGSRALPSRAPRSCASST